MRITVSVDAGMNRFASRIDLFSKQAERAMVEGLNEGGDLARTRVRRMLKEQTGAQRYAAIVARVGSRAARPHDLEYRIFGLGKGMPIREFPVVAGRELPVTANVWGVPHTFKRSFAITNDAGRLRARRGSSRLPIRALYGPSVAKEIVKGETAADFMASAPGLVQPAIIRRLGRLLP